MDSCTKEVSVLFSFERFIPKTVKIFSNRRRGLSSAGRAPALHAGGQRFDPARLHCQRRR